MLKFTGWSPEEITLHPGTSLAGGQLQVGGSFDAFDDYAGRQGLAQFEQIFEGFLTGGTIARALYIALVDLDDVWLALLDECQGAEARAEVIDSDPAAGMAQAVDQIHRAAGTRWYGALGDFDDQAAGQAAVGRQVVEHLVPVRIQYGAECGNIAAQGQARVVSQQHHHPADHPVIQWAYDVQTFQQWKGIEAKAVAVMAQQAFAIEHPPRFIRGNDRLERQVKASALQFVIEHMRALQVVQWVVGSRAQVWLLSVHAMAFQAMSGFHGLGIFLCPLGGRWQ